MVMDDPTQVSTNGDVGEFGEVAPDAQEKESGEVVVVKTTPSGKSKIIWKTKVGQKPSKGVGNPKSEKYHQGHYPHSNALDVTSQPEEHACGSDSDQMDGYELTSSSAESSTQNKPAIDEPEDL